jgi:hypothetical protein
MRRALLLLAFFPALSLPVLGQTPAAPDPGILNNRVIAPAADPNDNPRVVAMTNMGLDDSIIVAKIQSSSWTFKLSDSDIMALRKAGVSARVVAAMVDSSVLTTASVTVDDQPVPLNTMGQAKSAGRVMSSLTGDLTPVKENAFLEGPAATTSASPMPEITVHMPKGDSIGNYILVKMNVKNDRRELEVGSGTGGASGRTGLGSNAAIHPIRVIYRGNNTYQLLPLKQLEEGQYMVYVVGSSDERKDVYGKGYDFSVLR